MKRLLLLTAASLLLLSAATAPEGFTIWTSQALKAYSAKLAPKVNEQKIATENLANFGNYYTMVAHREASGEAELHDKWNDIFVIESGEGTVVVGGSIDGRHETGPGEIRGKAVTGGEHHPVKPGDVVHIPAGAPHQMLVPKGAHVTYFVIKVEKK